MKKILIFLSAITLANCSDSYDDSKLWDSVNGLENRVTKLEELCKQMNTNISSLQTIVAAIQNSESVVSVIPITKQTETVGYTIVFSKGGSVTVYYGYNGVIGEAGQEDSGAIPMIGVKKDADDIYYWTLNGEFIVIDGEKRPVYGLVNGSTSDSVAPRLKLENNDWYVTYDNGRTWERLGSAQGSKDGAMIRDIS